MSLRLEGIRFRNFRSYESLSLSGFEGLTVLLGPNATGKTNAIEGIQLLTAYGSFRNATGKELVRWGSRSAQLSAHIVSQTRDLTVQSDIQPGARTHLLNGKRKTVQELQGLLPSVVFSPDDLVLVKGAQSHRRSALDLLGCQLSMSHRVIKRDFERLVKHKNALLRNDASRMLVESVNDMLAPAATQLYLYRAALVDNLSARMAAAYEAMSGGKERVEVSYIASWESDEVREAAQAAPIEFAYTKDTARSALEKALASRLAEECVRKRSVVGPHHDRLEFFVDGRNASMFASQGQQRSIVLAWKMAEVGIMDEMLKTPPVLLLDDVMSELDVARRKALVELLSADMQTFITATDSSCFNEGLLVGAKVIELGRG